MERGSPLSQKDKVYGNLYNTLLEHHNAERHTEADDLAEILLLVSCLALGNLFFLHANRFQHADLPIFYRAVAHMILATNLKGPALDHATRAIPAFEEMKTMVSAEEFPQGAFDRARRILEKAEAHESKLAEEDDADGADGEDQAVASGGDEDDGLNKDVEKDANK